MLVFSLRWHCKKFAFLCWCFKYYLPAREKKKSGDCAIGKFFDWVDIFFLNCSWDRSKGVFCLLGTPRKKLKLTVLLGSLKWLWWRLHFPQKTMLRVTLFLTMIKVDGKGVITAAVDQERTGQFSMMKHFFEFNLFWDLLPRVVDWNESVSLWLLQ